MTKSKLKHLYYLPTSARFRKIQEKARKDVLRFGNVDDITANQELEDLCDCLTLIRSGAIELEYTDCVGSKMNEGVLLKLNVE